MRLVNYESLWCQTNAEKHCKSQEQCLVDLTSVVWFSQDKITVTSLAFVSNCFVQFSSKQS